MDKVNQELMRFFRTGLDDDACYNVLRVMRYRGNWAN